MGRSVMCLRLAFAGVLLAASAAAEPRRVEVAAASAPQIAAWDARVSGLLGSGELRVRQVRLDTMLDGREHARLAQFHRGVPVFGGELVLQQQGGRVLSVFGTLYEGIDVETTPALSAAGAERIVAGLGRVPFGSNSGPELTVLPLDSGGYALTYRVRARASERVDIRVYFLDARTGAVVMDYGDLQAQSAVGSATGVLNDAKKISARASGGTFVADDALRPPVIATYDFKGDVFKLLFLQGVGDLLSSDLARDSDNVWTDGANVDAHVYAGYTYDYYFKRFGRRGLDNANIPIRSITHPVRREDIFRFPNNELIGDLYLNAFYAGDGLIVYGEGLPPGLVDNVGRSWDYVAGGLDIVGHELTHGVTDYSSSLIYRNESGALNEAFSDMMGTSIEFDFQPARADYLIGEDVISGGLRSMQSPLAYGDPDHYTIRYTGPEDGGGVHINSGIPNQAFYLSIEGGTNRFSGLAVQGVGAANRVQIERTFYRAFSALLAPSATFSQARAATVQAARELYGVGGAVERAVTQAWTAVGVN